MEYYLPIKWDRVLTQCNIDEFWKHAKGKNSARKGHIVCDFIYIKCPN
jgi:hypothetical protein